MIPRVTITVGLAVPSGDPDSLRAAARRLRQVADHGLATAGVRGGAGAELAGVWSGSAATGAAAELATLSTRAQAVLPQVDDGGRALAAYADSLEAAIATARSLSTQAGRAADEHRRKLATIDLTHAVDPVLHAVASTRAEQLHDTELTGIHRRYGAAMDALTAAGTRCARTLAGLTPRVTSVSPIAATPTLDPDLVYDLPLVRSQLAAAAAAGVGHVSPREEPSWFDSTLAAAGTAGAWAYNHTAVPLVNGAADVVQAAAQHPEDVAQLALGAGMMMLGAGGRSRRVSARRNGRGSGGRRADQRRRGRCHRRWGDNRWRRGRQPDPARSRQRQPVAPRGHRPVRTCGSPAHFELVVHGAAPPVSRRGGATGAR